MSHDLNDISTVASFTANGQYVYANNARNMFAGNGTQVLDTNLINGVTVRGMLVQKPAMKQCSTNPIFGVTGVVGVGSNVVRVSNESDSVTGTVSKINNELVLFRGVFQRTLGQGGKLMSDLFVANGVIGGTYFEAIKTADQHLQIVATKIDKTQVACSNLTFEAGEIIVAADFKLDSNTNLATGLVILQLSDVYRLLQFQLDINQPDKIVNTGTVVYFEPGACPSRVEWTTVGIRFAVGHQCDTNNQVQVFEFSKPNDTKPTLIQTIAASKDYLFVTSSKFMSVSYAVNDASIVDLYSQLFLKKVFTFQLGRDATVNTMAISDSANLIQVSVSSGLDTNRVVSYRLSDDYSIHSIINYASSQDHIATISNTYYEEQGISDKYLLLSIFASTFSSGNCFGFYELYSQGPHALVDYSGLTSMPADGMIDVNITTAKLVNGFNQTTLIQTKLKLTDIDYSLNVTAKETNKVEAKVGAFNLSSLMNIKGAVGPSLTINSTDAYVIAGFEPMPALMNFTQNFDKSVMSQQYLFASASEGLKVFDVQRSKEIWSIQPEVCLSPVGLSKVEGLNFDDVRFYALCQQQGQFAQMPSMILVTVTADGKAVQQIMQLGMSSVDLLSLTYSMKTKRLFLTAVSQQTSTILMVGIVTIDNQQLTLTQ